MAHKFSVKAETILEYRLKDILEDLKRTRHMIGPHKGGGYSWAYKASEDMIHWEIDFVPIAGVMKKYDVTYPPVIRLYKECKELYDEIDKILSSKEYIAGAHWL